MKATKTIHKSRLLAFKGELLLVLEKTGTGKHYTLPGGVKKKKETEREALIRETTEEIGYKLRSKDIFYFISKLNKPKQSKKRVVKHYFISLIEIEQPTVLEPHKFKCVLWIPWYKALDYLDKEDRSAVSLYCDQFRQQAN